MGHLPLLIFLLAGEPQQSAVPTSPSQDPPIGGIERLNWVVKSTIGPASLYTGLITAGYGSITDHPKEYGQNFVGFAQRYGLRMSGVATSNVMEASLGVIWNEDPRYHRAEERGVARRFNRVVKMTFLSEGRDGSVTPAYARFIAIAGSNALSNAWRPDSDATGAKTFERIGFGFGGRLLGNLWEEFWPDVRKHVFFIQH